MSMVYGYQGAPPPGDPVQVLVDVCPALPCTDFWANEAVDIAPGLIGAQSYVAYCPPSVCDNDADTLAAGCTGCLCDPPNYAGGYQQVAQMSGGYVCGYVFDSATSSFVRFAVDAGSFEVGNPAAFAPPFSVSALDPTQLAEALSAGFLATAFFYLVGKSVWAMFQVLK